MVEADVLEVLQTIATRELDFAGPVLPAMRLKEDLQLDSMQLIVVAVGLENRFRVKLDEADAGVLLTVSDLCRLVIRRVGEQGGAA